MSQTAPLWLVGAGPMAQTYALVLKDRDGEFAVIGRGASSAATFEEKTGVPARQGGLEDAIASIGAPEAAIVSTPVNALADNCIQLLRAGTKRILVEKPAGIDPEATTALAALAEEHGAKVYVAYNRRFYHATQKAKELIEEDGGATSLRMEFTEWSHRIAPAPQPDVVKDAWVYANSSHVLDMGFFLAGFPTELSAKVKGSLDWHPAGAQFVGHGETASGALFSYHADWEAAPRWMVEVGTAKRTIVFQPLEKLKYREITGFAETDVELDDLDTRYKPGLWRQVEAFCSGAEGADALCTIEEHASHMDTVYRTIRNGGAYQAG